MKRPTNSRRAWGQPPRWTLLVKAGAKDVNEEWPRPPGGAPTARAALEKILPLIEMSGEAVFKSRGCVSCHNNSLPAMTVALARKKGFVINEAQAKKELGFAVATDMPFLEPMRLGSTIGGGSDTLGYTLMGMAAAGYPADALTDSHIHYLSIYQFPDGAWRTTSYRPPEEYGPFTTTAVALRAIRALPDSRPARGVRGAVHTGQTMAAVRQGLVDRRTIDAAQRVGKRRRQRR